MSAEVSLLFEMFLQSTLKDGILKTNQRLLVGVSGGPDSLFLLLCLARYQARFNWTIAVAHLNHGLRGEIADQECAFVEALAQANNIPFFTRKVDLKMLNSNRKKGMEEAGRVARRDFFLEIAKVWHADAVLLGHHADDQVENFFIRLLRGAGPEGLLPMKKFSILPNELKIVRPLLEVRHRDIVDFLDREGFVYCQDQTNEEDVYLRSKIRSRILPKLEKSAPNIKNQILNLQTMMQWDQDFLASELKKRQEDLVADPFGLCSISCDEIGNWPEALASRWLINQFYAVATQGEPIQYQHVSLILSQLKEQPSYWSMSLPAGITAVISGGRFFILTEEQKTFDSQKNIGFRLPSAERIPFRQEFSDPSFCLTLKPFTGRDYAVGGIIGLSALGKEMFLRTWRAGDTIKITSGHSKKVSDYFQERRVPIPWRCRIPLLVEQEQIVLIPNHYTIQAYQAKSQEQKFEFLIENYPL